MTYIVFPAEIALDAMRFQDNSSAPRYYLAGFFVHSRPDGSGRVVSTDSHRLGVFRIEPENFHFPTDAASPIIALPPALAKECKYRHGKRWLRISVDSGMCEVVEAADANEAGTVAARVCLSSGSSCVIDGSFPDYERFIPRGELRAVSGPAFNAAYLADFGKVSTQRAGTIALWNAEAGKDPNGSPFVITVVDRPDFLGVLMPHRTGNLHPWNDADDWRAAYVAPLPEPQLKVAA